MKTSKRTLGILIGVIVIILAIVIGLVIGLHSKTKNSNIVSSAPSNSVQAIPDTKYFSDGRQCYSYSHTATKTEPYTTSELIDITVLGNSVTGTITGNQAGPDMTNGYTGTLVGTIQGDTINSVFKYVIEGSSGQERQIYKMMPGHIGIEKLRYPLIMESGMQVPDTTQSVTLIQYSRVGCSASG